MSLAEQLGFPLGDDPTDDTTRVQKLLTAWVSGLQPIETVAQDMIAQRDVDRAVGAQLDALGKLVGSARAGNDDVTYRWMIKTQIVVNRSCGTFEDLIKVAVLGINDENLALTVQNAGAATVSVLIEGIPLTLSVATFLGFLLQKTKSGGVRLQLVFNSAPDPANWFYLDGGPHGTSTLDNSIMFDSLG